MELPDAKVIARWTDRMIVVFTIGCLAWVTWQLGGFVPSTMVVGLPAMSGVAGLVALRWWVIAPTGPPTGWWYPLPLLAWVSCHMLGLAELPSRGWLHGWHLWSGLGAFWAGLHLARNQKLWRGTMAGVGVIALGVVAAAIYQRTGDASWLPLGREQVAQYLGRSAGTFGNPNTMAAWLAVILPIAVILAFRPSMSLSGRARGLAAAVAVAALLGIGMSFSRGVGLAVVAVAVLAWLVGSRWSWPRRWGLFGGLFVMLVGMGWWGYQESAEVQQRMDSLVEFKGERTRPLLWGIAIDLWQERPLVGYGGASFGGLMEHHRPEGLWESADYAHNEYLNGLSDYGLVGAVLGGGLVVLLIRRGRRVSPSAPGAGLGLGIVALAILLDFHLQSPAVWWLVALAIGARLADRALTDCERFTDTKPGPMVWIGGSITAALWLLPLVLAVPSFRAEELRWCARETLDKLENEQEPAEIRAVADRATESLRRAATLDGTNERIWQDLAYALSLREFGNSERSVEVGIAAEVAARRALGGSDLVAEHWVRLGVALDLQGRWAEAGPAFGRAITLAPRQPVMWYYQGFHFSLRPATRELAKAALTTCLRLDPWYDGARLLLVELERTP